MDMDIFKEKLNTKTFNALCDMASFIDCNYSMQALYNGKDELKFRKTNKTLVTFYMRESKLTVLIIFGKKEREAFESRREEFSSYINSYYDSSKTYHDGKWMFIDIADNSYTGEILKMISIKKKPNENTLTMCGYKCDLCKAYAKNIKTEDRREQLSQMWIKHFDLHVKPENIYCDGCRSKKKDAIYADGSCPVKECVQSRKLKGCFDCGEYPCDTFNLRKGLSYCEACEKLGDDFIEDDYFTYIKAYDNKTRIDRYKKINDKYDIMPS